MNFLYDLPRSAGKLYIKACDLRTATEDAELDKLSQSLEILCQGLTRCTRHTDSNSFFPFRSDFHFPAVGCTDAVILRGSGSRVQC